MPHVLHLVKDPRNSTALEVIRTQATDPSVQLTIVLMHDAVRLSEPLPGRLYRLRDGHVDLPSQPGSDAIGSSELLDLIFTADSIVTW
jgi:hypothetical protein